MDTTPFHLRSLAFTAATAAITVIGGSGRPLWRSVQGNRWYMTRLIAVIHFCTDTSGNIIAILVVIVPVMNDWNNIIVNVAVVIHHVTAASTGGSDGITIVLSGCFARVPSLSSLLFQYT
jgi:hypothetical protein